MERVEANSRCCNVFKNIGMGVVALAAITAFVIGLLSTLGHAPSMLSIGSQGGSLATAVAGGIVVIILVILATRSCCSKTKQDPSPTHSAPPPRRADEEKRSPVVNPSPSVGEDKQPPRLAPSPPSKDDVKHPPPPPSLLNPDGEGTTGAPADGRGEGDVIRSIERQPRRREEERRPFLTHRF